MTLPHWSPSLARLEGQHYRWLDVVDFQPKRQLLLQVCSSCLIYSVRLINASLKTTESQLSAPQFDS